MSAPTVLWLWRFFVVPTLAVISIAFRGADPYGGISDSWTLDTLFGLGNPNYPAIIWRTIWISFVSTAICLALAVPAGYYLARVAKKWRDILLVLIVVPFWTNFLIRIFAWKSFLHPEGISNNCCCLSTCGFRKQFFSTVLRPF